ncbi:hypothetical protein MLD38_015016 [Melastoma candidum]|uniref:Uncharacterized protein n=1 Tax=Melastoma candidum TaxID=119954 RepID=A0ACB9REQ4_9MYRT|nr:hypothetical protein MLD38_015016 [Melastoma candidum]
MLSRCPGEPSPRTGTRWSSVSPSPSPRISATPRPSTRHFALELRSRSSRSSTGVPTRSPPSWPQEAGQGHRACSTRQGTPGCEAGDTEIKTGEEDEPGGAGEADK